MERKFKCRDCGTYFTANDDNWVDCPTCGNDNIEIARSSRRWGALIGATVGVIVVVVGTLLVLKFVPENKEVERTQPQVFAETANTIEKIDVAETETAVPVDITPFNIKASEPVLDNTSRTYSVDAVAHYLPDGCSTEFRIYDFKTGGQVASNRDGHFTGLPASEDEVGTYTITVYALDGSQLVDSATCVVSGFVKLPEPGMTKLSQTEVQALVDEAVAAGRVAVLTGNDAISPEISLSYEDLRDEEDISTAVSAMIPNIKMLDIWSGYTVVNVGYDSMNRVNHITLKPIWK